MKGAATDEAVAKYKKFIGVQRFNKIENAEKKAVAVFEEICDIYGEQNAVKMVGTMVGPKIVVDGSRPVAMVWHVENKKFGERSHTGTATSHCVQGFAS